MTDEFAGTTDTATSDTATSDTATSDTGSMVSDNGGIVSSLRDGTFLKASSKAGPDCSICLEQLRVGEEIGLAQNPACCHVYHKECISEWLLHHTECPLCKQHYLGMAF